MFQKEFTYKNGIFIYLPYLGKERRINMDFPAAKTILNIMKTKTAKKRVGIISEGPPSRGEYMYIGACLKILK